MKNEKNNILVYGLASSGSSAVVDLLREYNSLNIIPDEFDDFRAPGLVADQLCYSNSNFSPNKIDALISNISKKRLIYNIFPIFKWEIVTITGIKSRFKYSTIRLRQLHLLKKLNRKLLSDISLEDKIHLANNWITDVGKINIKNKESIVYNQPIDTGIDDTIWRAVFNPYKLICVYRDPKDQLADIIRRGLISASWDGPYLTVSGANANAIYGRNRKGAIQFHIDAIKKRLEWIDSMKMKLDQDKFLLIDFEGLIYNYDAYISAIEDFIGVSKNNHTQSMKLFNPHKSKENIGIYKNILSNKELDLLTELDSWYKKMLKQNQVTNKCSKIMSAADIY
ncbi:MAG TPA: hypothetical protein VGK10_02565 [Prolixibacteraceae bacterium]|jgi:hypothetical protein